jgi:hypothetical protein
MHVQLSLKGSLVYAMTAFTLEQLEELCNATLFSLIRYPASRFRYWPKQKSVWSGR